MKIKNSLIVASIVTMISFTACFDVFAATDPFASLVNELIAKPQVKEIKAADGTTYRIQNMESNPGLISGRSTTPDGSVTDIKITTYDDGSRLIEKTTNGVTEVASVDIDGKVTGSTSIQKLANDIQSATASSGPSYTYTTEEVPGIGCVCADESDSTCSNIKTRLYKCPSGEGLSGFKQLFATIIKYFINISLLLGVLALAIFGVSLSLLGGDEEGTKKAKKYAVNLLIGLTILFLFKYILVFLAPWIFQ